MTMSSETAAEGHGGGSVTKRDFLFLMTGSLAAVGAVATAWPFIDQMNPDAATIAAAGPVDIDIQQLQPGQRIVALWAARPVFVVKRDQSALDELKNQKLLDGLRDPGSQEPQQPAYAANWSRSIKPEISGDRRRLHSPRLHPAVRSAAQRNRPGAGLAGRILLPLPRLQIRSRRAGVPGRSRALQPSRSAVSFSRRQDGQGRRKSAGAEFRLQFDFAGVTGQRSARLLDLDRVVASAATVSCSVQLSLGARPFSLSVRTGPVRCA